MAALCISQQRSIVPGTYCESYSQGGRRVGHRLACLGCSDSEQSKGICPHLPQASSVRALTAPGLSLTGT